MTCFHPIKMYIPTSASLTAESIDYYAHKKAKFKPAEGYRQIEVPCGRCDGCKLDLASSWATRCTLEAKNWKNNCVISLTYNDREVHHDEKSGLLTLKKKDLQDFLKRLRYYEKGIEKWTHPIKNIKEKPIRYFACGEYGRSGTRAPLGGNPHFHVIFFNWMPDDLKFYKYNKYGNPIYTSKKLMKIWGHGFCTVEDFTYNNACYVARYVQKKAGIAPVKREYMPLEKEEFRIKVDERNGNVFIAGYKRKIKQEKLLQEKEFIVMSRGVGIGVLEWIKHKETIKNNEGILLKNKGKVKKKPIPRYFKKLWESENWEEYYRFKFVCEQKAIKKKMEIISMITMPDGTTDEFKWEFYLHQQEKILQEKSEKYKRRNNFI